MARPTPISKDEALKQLSAELEVWLEKAILMINAKLGNFRRGSQRLIDDSDVDLKSLSKDAQARAVIEIKAIYSMVGWKVSYDFGGQCGPEGWFTFS